jgi:RNA polymerase sigma-70 factor (ECF subfamily)
LPQFRFGHVNKTYWLPQAKPLRPAERSAKVTVRDELNLLTPRLRRYARALAQAAPGPSESADELVHATLVRVLDAESLDRKSNLTLTAFALLTQVHRDSLQERKSRAAGSVRNAAASRPSAAHEAPEPPCGGGKGLFEGLATLKLDEREALLLVVVEQFTYTQAMHILDISRPSLVARLARARSRLSEALAIVPAPNAAQGRVPHLRLVK